MTEKERRFGVWTFIDDGPPAGDKSEWLRAEIERAERLLAKVRSLAENDERVHMPRASKESADALRGRNVRRIQDLEQYIEETRAQLKTESVSRG